MNIYVFTGPTIPPRDARDELDAIFLPPASEGDVYRAACNRPLAIGIIDGYFESVPSVWHKEILWAMNRGIHVFGGASMGALRAAELTVFGMEGVGRVFEAFRDGLLEDDDEVAVAHLDERHDYVPTSIAMVNIRATLINPIYPYIAGRAADKQAKLRAQEKDNPAFADAGINENELFYWYFMEILKRPVPVDLAGFARTLGFEDIVAFRQWLLREYCYSRSSARPDSCKK